MLKPASQYTEEKLAEAERQKKQRRKSLINILEYLARLPVRHGSNFDWMASLEYYHKEYCSNRCDPIGIDYFKEIFYQQTRGYRTNRVKRIMSRLGYDVCDW